MWLLNPTEANGATRAFRLVPRTIKTMGRAPRADFVVRAALVSRFHCRFTLSGDGLLTVEDLGSTNGTFVNSKKVARAELAAGDIVRVGRVEFTVSAD
jgi:pSer/pThr/pTyr-binding forkhead associated (FHA) protein